jgi:hypothetical protein
MEPVDYAHLAAHLKTLSGVEKYDVIGSAHDVSIHPGWSSVLVVWWCANRDDVDHMLTWDEDTQFVWSSRPYDAPRDRYPEELCVACFSYSPSSQQKYLRPSEAYVRTHRQPKKVGVLDDPSQHSIYVPTFECNGEYGEPEFFRSRNPYLRAYQSFCSSVLEEAKGSAEPEVNN